MSANQVDIAGINNRYAAVAHISEALSLCADVPLDSLTRQRALLDGLFARVPEAIVLLDTDDRILQVNPEFTRLFGYAQEEARGRLINELVVPEELLAEEQECMRGGLRGESLNLEAVRKHKDGTRVHVSILSAPVSIAGSQICEYVIHRDITERKRAEQRLGESEAYLAEAQRLSQTGSWAWNPATGEIRYWSEMCYCVLGFDPGGPLPRFEEFFHRIHPDDQAASRERFEQAIRDKADFELDYRIIHPEKEIRDIHVVGHAVLDGSGILGEFVGTVIDVTERKRAFEEVCKLRDKLAQEKLYLEEEIRSEMSFENIVGNSPALKHVLELVETVAPNDSTVLLLGETGTGKELIARAIHERSRRKDRTFVKLNCAAIPMGLLESELFGHEKGAFTGAIIQKLGRMELADQGTLFLDEVGDIPIEIQPKLLRALQEREFERLGSTHTRRVNVRLIAATNRDLEKMIADREFRSDLYYRLHVFPIRIPPLRERKEDIPQLVSYFVQKFAKQMLKKIDSISPAVMKGLTAWDWPGNIRELENFIERSVIVTRGRSLEAPLGELRKTNTVAFPHVEQQNVEQAAGERTDSQTDKASVADEYDRKRRDEIIRALTACRGSVGGACGAAARLGVNRTTLLARMKKFGVYAKQYA